MDNNGSFLYIQGKSAAGFIYYYGREQRFFSICPAADNPNFFPRHCTICSSTKGLLLCLYPYAAVHGLYAVCNPYILGSTRFVPSPPNGLHHAYHDAQVLVVYPHPIRHHYVFHVVCALQDPARGAHIYILVYSSRTDQWRTSGPHILGHIRDETGISVGTKAYWLLHDRPSVAYYDALVDTAGAIDLPYSYASLFPRGAEIHLQAQLGAFGDDLCYVGAWGKNWRSVHMYMRADDRFGDRWSYRIDWSTYLHRRHVMLSRFESDRLQVPFWFYDRRLVIRDHGRNTRHARAVPLLGPLRNLGDDILPLVHTLLHPVVDFLIFQL